MASSSEARRAVRGLVLLLLVALGQGCATGRLLEEGRRTESVVRYREAYTDGSLLWLVYETETRNQRGVQVGRDSRTAVVRLDDLDPARGLPLDALPMERPAEVAPRSRPLRPVRLQHRSDPVADEPGEPALRVDEREGRETGFSLEAFEGLPADARFDSGSLIQRETAPWVYPLLPIAAACDAAAMPTVVFFALPFFVIGD